MIPKLNRSVWWRAGLIAACAIVVTLAVPVTGAQNPSLLFSTPAPGSQIVRMAVDAQGYIYLAGRASGINPAGSFVTKLTPSRSVVYTTYLQATRFQGEPGDCQLEVNAIAVDRTGAAYVTGCTSATDFPLASPFRSTLQGSRSSGFVTKLSPFGTLVYSTYFGSGGGNDAGTGISVDDQGNAYVVGIGSGQRLPLVNPAHSSGTGFAAKFDPKGSSLLYATYLGASPRAIVVDQLGAAYITGAADARLPVVRPIQPCHDEGGSDAFVIKLNPAGSSYDYATCLGGSRDDEATGIAIDAGGSAYVVGTTRSMDLPTARALDPSGRTGPLWKTENGGLTWRDLPLDSYNVYGLVSATANAGTWYAGTLEGGFKSLDQGAGWRRLGLPLRESRFQPSVMQLAADPRAPSTLYASTSEGLFKSSDGGDGWTAIGATLPFGGSFLRGVAVNPADSRVIYAASQRGFWKSINGGADWAASNQGLGTEPYVSFLSVDPVTGTLYADVLTNDRGVSINRVFTSTDAGVHWTPTSLEIRQRFVTALTAVPSRRTRIGGRTRRSRDEDSDDADRGPASLYIAARQVFSEGPFGALARSDDGGATWESIGAGLPPSGPDVLAVAPSNPHIVYAASRGVVFVSGDRGATFEPVPGMPTFGSVESLAVDPLRAETLFVGTTARSDTFVARIRPGGGALEYSTYLGGAGDDRGAGILVDELGRAIVFGSTDAGDFPTVRPVQQRGDNVDGFVSVLDGGGSVLLFSTWLGGPGADRIDSAARFGGSILISGGSTDLGGMFPGSTASGGGGFVGVLDSVFGSNPFRF